MAETERKEKKRERETADPMNTREKLHDLRADVSSNNIKREVDRAAEEFFGTEETIKLLKNDQKIPKGELAQSIGALQAERKRFDNFVEAMMRYYRICEIEPDNKKQLQEQFEMTIKQATVTDVHLFLSAVSPLLPIKTQRLLKAVVAYEQFAVESDEEKRKELTKHILAFRRNHVEMPMAKTQVETPEQVMAGFKPIYEQEMQRIAKDFPLFTEKSLRLIINRAARQNIGDQRYIDLFPQQSN